MNNTFRINGIVIGAYGPFAGWEGRNVHMSGVIVPDSTGLTITDGPFRINQVPIATVYGPWRRSDGYATNSSQSALTGRGVARLTMINVDTVTITAGIAM